METNELWMFWFFPTIIVHKHFHYACHLSWKALWEEALWGNSPSAHLLVWGSGRIHYQLAEDCRVKGRSLTFGSQRGAGECFASLGATSHGLVYGSSGSFSSLQPVYRQPPRPSLLTGEPSQSGQSFTCCNTGGNNVFLCEGIGEDHAIEAFLNTFFFIFWHCNSQALSHDEKEGLKWYYLPCKLPAA